MTSGDFAAANGCGTSLAGHSTCSIAVTFAPRSVGAQTGTLVVTDVLRSQTITLTGTATAGAGITLLPNSLTFGQTGVGNATAPQNAVLTNNGGVSITLTSVTVGGDFGLTAASGICAPNATLAVGESCLLPVAFAPRVAGARTGTLTVTSNATTQTVSLAGTGVDFSLAATGPTSATIATGKNAVFPLLLTPAVTGNQPVTFTCSGVPASTRCTVVSTYSDLSATSTVTVTVLTGTTAALHGVPDWTGRDAERNAFRGVVCAVLLAPLAWFCPRKRRYSALAMLCLLLLAVPQGCGSGRKIPDSTGGGSTGTTGNGTVTPAGTYNLTVTANAAGLSRQVQLTLIVTAS